MRRASWYRYASYMWMALGLLRILTTERDTAGVRPLWAALAAHQLDHFVSERSRHSRGRLQDARWQEGQSARKELGSLRGVVGMLPESEPCALSGRITTGFGYH